MVKFMREGVVRAGHNESYFTLGMRGPGDSPIEADDPIAVLRDVFKSQRDIFTEVHGSAKAVDRKAI